MHAFDSFIDPVTELPWRELGHVAVSPVADGWEVVLGYPTSERVQDHYRQAMAAHGWHAVSFQTQIKHHRVAERVKPLPGIKNVVAVGSGKGGVGKTMVASQLALGLKRLGARVGLLDADIYGPNLPEYLGLDQALEVSNGQLQPVDVDGMPVVSMAMLVDGEQPMVWRGPMVSKAVWQLMGQTCWPELDYLIVDLPPGTGDVQLTMAQKMPVVAALVVSTPQRLARLDAGRGVAMFQKVGIPVLGYVENMSVYHCQHCHKAQWPLGQSEANDWGVCLATLPLDARVQSPGGWPDLEALFDALALRCAQGIAELPVEYRHSFPDVVLK